MSDREQAWQERAESAERENARLHAVVEELREQQAGGNDAPR